MRATIRSFTPRHLLLALLIVVGACWATVPYQTLPPVPEPSDDDGNTDADDDDVALPDDDDGTAWDALCHAGNDGDWDCDEIEDGQDGLLIVDDQFWVHKTLMGNLDLSASGRACVVGHGLEVAENDPDVDTDWAQCEFRMDCQAHEEWCRLPVEAVERIPVRNDLRLSVSDGTATALLNLPESEVFDHWASFGPDYCVDVPDPACWDNTAYEGPGHALCLQKRVIEGHVYLSAGTNCGAHTYEEVGS